MAGKDLLGFRRGIDNLGNRQTIEQINRSGEFEERRAKAIVEQTRHRDAQIAQGLKGLGDAMRNDELHEADMVLKRQQKTLNDQTIDLNTKINPEKIKEAGLRNAGLDIGNQQAKVELEQKTWKNAQEKDAADGEQNALITDAEGDPKFKRPAEWATMNPTQKAAYVSQNNKNIDTKLGQSKKVADIGLTKAQTADASAGAGVKKATAAKIEVETAIDMQKLVATPNLISQFKDNPAMIATHGLPPGEQGERLVKEAGKNFEAAKGKVAVLKGYQDGLFRIGKLAGVTPEPDGSYDLGKVDKAFAEYGGLRGWMKRVMQDPNAAQMKMEITTFLSAVAKEKTFGALNFASEVERAKTMSGGDVGSDQFTEAFIQTLDESGKARTLFSHQNQLYVDTKRDVGKLYTETNGFQYVPTQQVLGLVYDTLPANRRMDPQSKDFVDYNKFIKPEFSDYDAPGAAPGQGHLNEVWGLNPETKQPNVLAADSFSNNYAIERGVKNGTIQAQAQARTIDWQNDSNKKLAATLAPGMSAKQAYSSPSALAGMTTDVPHIARGSGEMLDPQRANPQTPRYFNSVSGSWEFVTQPNGKVSPGPTPLGGRDEVQTAVGAKYALPKGYAGAVRDAFGVDKDKQADMRGGGAYAAPSGLPIDAYPPERR